MEVRINKNYNLETNEDLFGLSLKVDGGHRYCKYPIEHQEYKTITDAHKAKGEVSKQFAEGAIIIYPNNLSKGINKSEPVKIRI